MNTLNDMATDTDDKQFDSLSAVIREYFPSVLDRRDESDSTLPGTRTTWVDRPLINRREFEAAREALSAATRL